MSKNKYVNLQLKYCTLLPTFICLNTWSLFLDLSLCELLITRPSYHQQFGLCLMAIDFLFLNLRTILLHTLTTKTLFLQIAKNSSHQLQEMQTITDSSNHKITEGELNNLIRDLELPKNKAEHWASMLRQWNLLHHSTNVTTFRTRNQEFDQIFKIEIVSPAAKTLMV